MIWRHAKDEGRRQGRLVFVFGINNHGAMLSISVADHFLTGWERRHIVIEVFYHKDDCSRARLGAWNKVALRLVPVE